MFCVHFCIGRLDEAEWIIHEWQDYLKFDVPRRGWNFGSFYERANDHCFGNLAKLCLSFLQLHKLEKSIIDYEIFKHVLQDCPCLPTDPVARLRSTDLAMDRIKLFVIGFDKRNLMKNKESLMKKIDDSLSMLSCGPHGSQFLVNFSNERFLGYEDVEKRLFRRILEGGVRETIREFLETHPFIEPMWKFAYDNTSNLFG